jgi:DNA polymerase III alpha subunit (gram-positive type)
MAQFAPFEMTWFSKKLGIDINEMAKIKVYDTRYAEKLLYPNVPHSLIQMCKRYGIEPPKGQHDFHRADQDVNAMWQVYLKQYNNIIHLLNPKLD